MALSHFLLAFLAIGAVAVSFAITISQWQSQWHLSQKRLTMTPFSKTVDNLSKNKFTEDDRRTQHEWHDSKISNFEWSQQANDMQWNVNVKHLHYNLLIDIVRLKRWSSSKAWVPMTSSTPNSTSNTPMMTGNGNGLMTGNDGWWQVTADDDR